MTKEQVIIIALIVVIIYLAYQQANNHSPHIIESPNTQKLRAELNHYQKLYENRVKKDLGFEQENKETQTDPDHLITHHQAQLRKINVLFDKNAKDYKEIDFDGLYTFLQQIAEREREQAKVVMNMNQPKNSKEEEIFYSYSDFEEWLKEKLTNDVKRNLGVEVLKDRSLQNVELTVFFTSILIQRSWRKLIKAEFSDPGIKWDELKLVEEWKKEIEKK